MSEIILNENQELKKKYILKCLSKEMSVLETAMTLAVTERTVYQKMADFKKKGNLCFIHGNSGKKRENKNRELTKQKIIDIFMNTKIEGENPFVNVTYEYFTIILEEFFEIKASTSWVTKILKSIGYVSPVRKKAKSNINIHLFRERKEHTGELVQADGTPYDWFMDGHLYCIQGFVDDATGFPTGLYMTVNECLLGYIEAFRNMAESEGIPEQIYPDKAGVFFVNKKTNDGEKHLTQFGLMMENFGVDMFPAHSPEAKGRIERFWQTIQHRLPTLFKLNGIKTIAEANIFLKNEFPKIYKKWFPKKPKSSETRFVKADMNEIAKVLKATYAGSTDKAGVFSFKGYQFFCPELPKTKIFINLNEQEGLWITKQNDCTLKRYSVKLIETDTSGSMPEVMKDLIERTFLQNAKPKYKEVYINIDDVVLSQIKPKNKTA